MAGHQTTLHKFENIGYGPLSYRYSKFQVFIEKNNRLTNYSSPKTWTNVTTNGQKYTLMKQNTQIVQQASEIPSEHLKTEKHQK
jgi:hypothetical protein